MKNTLDIITTVLMILGSLMCLAFVFYLRRRLYLKSHRNKFTRLAQGKFLELTIEEGSEVLYSPDLMHRYKINSKAPVKQKNRAYAYEEEYAETLYSCGR